MKNYFLILLLAIGLMACGPDGRVYEKHKDLSPDLEWLKVDARTFKVPIAETAGAYDFSLSFRYIEGYPFQVVKIKMTETSPSGAVSEKSFDLKLREDNGDYIGEPGLDIWDSSHLVEPGKVFSEKGTYTYVLEHEMPADPVNGVMEIGIVVDKAL